MIYACYWMELLFLFAPRFMFAQDITVTGRVVDPQGKALPRAKVQFEAHGRTLARATSGSDGAFELRVNSAGKFTLNVEAAGFRPWGATR